MASAGTLWIVLLVGLFAVLLTCSAQDADNDIDSSRHYDSRDCDRSSGSCEDDDDDDDGLSSGAIVGIIIGAIVVLILIILLIVCVCCKSKKKQQQRTTRGAPVAGMIAVTPVVVASDKKVPLEDSPTDGTAVPNEYTHPDQPPAYSPAYDNGQSYDNLEQPAPPVAPPTVGQQNASFSSDETPQYNSIYSVSYDNRVNSATIGETATYDNPIDAVYDNPTDGGSKPLK